MTELFRVVTSYVQGPQDEVLYKYRSNQTTMNNTTYKIQFFGGPKKVWKDLPTRLNIATLEEAKDFMKAQQEMCDYMVDFRIVEEVA